MSEEQFEMTYLIRENTSGAVDGYYATLEDAQRILKDWCERAGHNDFSLLKHVEDSEGKPQTDLYPFLADVYMNKPYAGTQDEAYAITGGENDKLLSLNTTLVDFCCNHDVSFPLLMGLFEMWKMRMRLIIDNDQEEVTCDESTVPKTIEGGASDSPESGSVSETGEG